VRVRGRRLSGVRAGGRGPRLPTPPPPAGGQGCVFSLDAGAAGQRGRGHRALQLLDHGPAVVQPAPPRPAGGGVSSSSSSSSSSSAPTQFTSSAAVFLFQSVPVPPLVPLGLLLLLLFFLPLAFARQVGRGGDALLGGAELLQSAAGFGRSALGVGPQQALPPVL